MSLKLKKQETGFTIIEVLIVLAIAGLIILIVFLAVPALQRNSRNTQRKNDVSGAIGAIQEAVNNNNGKMPNTVAAATANANPGFYTLTDYTGSTVNAAAVATVTPNDTGVIFNNFSRCPATVPATGAVATNTNANARSLTAIYRVETSSGYATQCQDL